MEFTGRARPFVISTDRQPEPMEQSVSNTSSSDHDVVWGGLAIAKVLNVSERRAWYMLEHGLLPATRVGKKWVASRSALLGTVMAAVAA